MRIHARRGDHVVAGGAAGHKETNATLLCVVDAALRRAPGATVCVYSEGRPEDFGPALAAHPRVHWRLGGDPLHTFHELVTAPTLFVAALPMRAPTLDCCTPMPSWSCECRLPPMA